MAVSIILAARSFYPCWKVAGTIINQSYVCDQSGQGSVFDIQRWFNDVNHQDNDDGSHQIDIDYDGDAMLVFLLVAMPMRNSVTDDCGKLASRQCLHSPPSLRLTSSAEMQCNALNLANTAVSSLRCNAVESEHTVMFFPLKHTAMDIATLASAILVYAAKRRNWKQSTVQWECSGEVPGRQLWVVIIGKGGAGCCWTGIDWYTRVRNARLAVRL